MSEQEKRDFFGDEPIEHLLDGQSSTDWHHLRKPDVLEAVIRDLRPEMIVGAWQTPRLRMIDGRIPTTYYCHLAGSIRNVVPRELIAAGMLVTNWGDSISRYVAEAALMLALSSARNLAHHNRNFHERGLWRSTHLPAWSLFGRRIGIHGFGNISRQLVSLLGPFHPTISVWDPFVSDEDLRTLGVDRAESLEALFENADFLFECCALTPETEGIVDSKLLACLPDNAIFTNVARGRLVDETALAGEVSKGRIRAGLDVFCNEPYPTDGPLRDNDFLVAMSHQGGNTVDSRRFAGRVALKRMRAYLSGEVPEDVVDLDRFARMT